MRFRVKEIKGLGFFPQVIGGYGADVDEWKTIRKSSDSFFLIGDDYNEGPLGTKEDAEAICRHYKRSIAEVSYHYLDF